MFSFGLCLFNKIHQEHYLWYRHKFNLILSPIFFALLSLITCIISQKLYHRNTNHDRDAWNKKNIFTTVEDNFNVTHLLNNVWEIIVIWLLRFSQQSFFSCTWYFFFFFYDHKTFFFLFFASMKNINHDLNIYLPCIQFSICSISLSYW